MLFDLFFTRATEISYHMMPASLFAMIFSCCMLMQTEESRKLKSELQSLTKKRQGWEDRAKKDWPTLSLDEVEAKLVKVRTTPQTDLVLDVLHGAYNDEKLKKEAIDTISKELDAKTSKLKEHDTELEKLKALQNDKNVQVSLPT